MIDRLYATGQGRRATFCLHDAAQSQGIARQLEADTVSMSSVISTQPAVPFG